MPRALRILVEGGLYHVYNRFARGEGVFSDLEVAIEFLDLLRELKQRDDLQIFAGSVPLITTSQRRSDALYGRGVRELS